MGNPERENLDADPASKFSRSRGPQALLTPARTEPSETSPTSSSGPCHLRWTTPISPSSPSETPAVARVRVAGDLRHRDPYRRLVHTNEQEPDRVVQANLPADAFFTDHLAGSGSPD